MKVSPDILSLVPYSPGKPIAETKRELGLSTVYKLASNENPLEPSPRVIEALQTALAEIHRYPDAACFAMGEAVAKYYRVERSWLTFGNGSNELIDLLIRVYCQPGDEILTSNGAFIAYKICAQAASVKTLSTPMTSDFRFDLISMKKQLESSTKIRLVFIANPNNPTGTYVTSEELVNFLEATRNRDILVVLDEAYVEFVRARDYPDGISLMKQFPHVVCLRTMSKVFGLAGLRVGALIAPPQVSDLINRVRNPFNVNSLAQAAVVAALEDPDSVKKVQQLTWNGLDFFYEQLKAIGLEFWPSQGNFVLVDCKRDSEAIFKSMLRQGVITRPVKNYGLQTHLRISVGLEKENQAAIAALRLALQEQQ